MKNSFLSLLFLLPITLLYLGCCEEDEQPNDGNVYEACCGLEPGTYTVNDVNFYLPNAFTPNADGTNDNYYAFAGSDLPSDFKINKIVLTSRSGEILAQELDLVPGSSTPIWDGKNADGTAYAGSFDYRFEINNAAGEVVVFTGSACSFLCDGITVLNVGNPQNCTFGLQHNGAGNFNSTLDTGETSCL